MKTLLFTLTFIGSAAIVSAQNVNIPDANFKAALLANPEINVNADTNIQVTEALFYDGTIDVSGQGIMDLSGIEAFVALERLICQTNLIMDLDISSNGALTYLDCSDNKLEDLDVSSLDLDTLICYENEIDELLLGTQTTLLHLNCAFNEIDELNLSSCIDIVTVKCEANEIYNLVLPAGEELKILECDYNLLDSLDVSLLTELEILNCNNNELIKLNVANGNNTFMTMPDMRNNPNLMCIEVDDSAYAYTNWAAGKDVGAEFSEDCDNFGVGIKENSAKSHFDVYPNPAQNELWIDASEPATLVITNCLGQPVLKKEIAGDVNWLKLDGFAPGLYYVNLGSETGSVTQTLIILP